jgi:beta-lactamase regulating signal transducer with metallopeptidase domain
MSAIPDPGTLLHTPLAQAVGWALMQFIWQGALVGVMTALALAALRRGGADVRYVVATISMSLMLALPAVSVIQQLNSAPPEAASAVRVEAQPNDVRASGQAPVGGGFRRPARLSPAIESIPAVESVLPDLRPDRFMSWLLVGWMIGVALLTVRLVTGWVWVQRLKSHGTSAPVPLCAVVEKLAGRLHIARAVRVVQSTAVDVPTVMGWLKPVLLLPASALAGLTPMQLEAVLAHELAHIRRHDYLVNLLQTAVETLLFYHPAVWWVSRQIRVERENCCDDLAVSLCGDRVLYAQALADLEQLRGSADRFVMAANGGSLVHRVRRLLGAPSHAGATPGWLALAVAVTVVVSMAGMAARAMDRETAKDDRSRILAAADEVHRGAEELRRDAKALQQRAPLAFDRLLHETSREFSQALRRSHRALNDALRDLFPQIPPLPPMPPEPPLPPEPPAAQVRPMMVDPVDVPPPAFPAPPSFPEPPSLAEPPASPEPPAFPEPPSFIDVPLAAPVPPRAPQAEPAPPARPKAGGQKSGNFVWADDGEKLEINYRGEIEFTDDDSDVKSLGPGGWLRIKDRGRNGSHAVEFRADASGTIERRFWIGTSERPFESEGRKWLAAILPRFIRQTGIGAEARVRRIYKAKGASGVLGEISLIDGSWGKRIYFTELFEIPGLDPRVVQQALQQAGKEVDSDFELASLLISSRQLLTEDTTRKAYIDASRSIDSDFEMRRVYSSAVKGGPLTPGILDALLEGSTAIGSDFELASLLIDVSKLQSLSDAARASLFKAMATIESDFEQRRALSAIVSRSDAAPALLAGALERAQDVGSDFELATLLVEFVRDRSIEGPLREPFFRAADTIESNFERGRVLQAAAKRSDASDQTILAIIKSAASMNGSFESARVLLTVAGAHPLSREARDAYVDAAERLGQHD